MPDTSKSYNEIISNIVSSSNTSIIATNNDTMLNLIAVLSLMYDLTDDESRVLAYRAFEMFNGYDDVTTKRMKIISIIYEIKAARG